MENIMVCSPDGSISPCWLWFYLLILQTFWPCFLNWGTQCIWGGMVGKVKQ